MPKVRTNRSASKRFKVTGTGKLKRHKAFTSHLLGSKTRKRKRRLRKAAVVSSADHGRVRKLLGI